MMMFTLMEILKIFFILNQNILKYYENSRFIQPITSVYIYFLVSNRKSYLYKNYEIQ